MNFYAALLNINDAFLYIRLLKIWIWKSEAEINWWISGLHYLIATMGRMESSSYNRKIHAQDVHENIAGTEYIYTSTDKS